MSANDRMPEGDAASKIPLVYPEASPNVRLKIMKRAVVRVLCLISCFGAAPAAWGSWSALTAAGTGAGVGTPSCAVVSAGVVACAALTAKAWPMIWIGAKRGPRVHILCRRGQP